MFDRSHIGIAYKVASDLGPHNLTPQDLGSVLAMALAISICDDPRAHRDLSILTKAMTDAAQLAFDAFREKKSGTA